MFSNMKSIKRAAVLAFAMFIIAALAVSAAGTNSVTVTTQRSPAGGIAPGQTVTDLASVQGHLDGKDPTGTVQFYICFNNGGTGTNFPTCNTPANGAALGSPVASTALTCFNNELCKYTSPGFSSGHVGTYCFLAVYTSNVGYPTTTDTTTNGTAAECGAIAGATAVTVSSMSAQLLEDGGGWAIWGLGALSIVSLGAVVFVIARKR